MHTRAAARADQNFTANWQQCPHNQLAQLAGTQHQHAVMFFNTDLALDMQRRSKWFNKDGLFITDMIRHLMQIANGCRQILGKGAITVCGYQSLRASRSAPGTAGTEIAIAAADIDFTNDALIEPFGRTLHYIGDKFMAGMPSKLE